jgi:hypothetical protein
VPDQIIRVTARPRADGIDIERLALALLELAAQLPESKRTHKSKRSTRRTADSGRDAEPRENEGAA